MGKRKRKKSGKGKGLFAWIGAFLTAVFRFSFRGVPILALGLVLGLLFFGVRKILYADLSLAIQRMIVEPPDILSLEKRQSLENRWVGKNILTADIQEIAEGLEQDPDIQTAKVTRYLPSLIKIQIEKRKPVAFIQLAPKGVFGVIAEDGMILDVVKQNNSSLVLIEAYGFDQKEPRKGLLMKHRGFAEGIQFLKVFWEHPLVRSETVTKITLDRLGNVHVLLGSGPEVRLGRRPVEDLEAMTKLAPLLEGEGRKNIEYVDLQFGNVIVKRKK